MRDATPDLANRITQAVVTETVALIGFEAYQRMLDKLVRNVDSDLSQLIEHLNQKTGMRSSLKPTRSKVRPAYWA
jgi:hypothetical protein